ncbi:MAG: DUF2752 domain-containing protein [Ruminiclostridium sp.]|nr:DUF2752 domain-containing protein [Ruminiclostridium sp.]
MMTDDRRIRVRRLAAVWGIVLGVLTLYAVVTMVTEAGIPCLFHLITGLSCPGCGISRAIRSLAALRFGEALRYNLFAPFILLYILYCAGYASVRYVRTGRKDLLMRPQWLHITLLAMILVWWVVRNIIGI